MRKLILGSSSPRRKEILEEFNISFEIRTMDLDEPEFEKGFDVYEFSKEVSLFKANALKSTLSNEEILLTSDTIVHFEGNVLGKPKNREEGFKTLNCLSGNTHEVISSFALMTRQETLKLDYDITEVTFKSLSDKQINAYLDTDTYLDKAGSYGIQDVKDEFIEEISGSWYNVVGLPIEKIKTFLKCQ